MLKALNLAATRVVTSAYDEGEEDKKTKFTLGTLDSRTVAMLRDKATHISVDPKNPDANATTSFDTNQLMFDAVVYGLRGVENYGEPFKSAKRNHGGQSYVVADPEFVKSLHPMVIAEIGSLILTDNELTVEEAKN